MVAGDQPKSIDSVTPKHVLEGSPKDQSKTTAEEKIKVPEIKQAEQQQQELTLKAPTKETATKTQSMAQEQVHRLIYNIIIIFAITIGSIPIT